jgi:hypothetical protein
MESLLQSHEELDGGKSLLANSFPVDSPQRLENRASSSRIAWQATKGNTFCKDIFTHQGWASWGGAATKGSLVKFPMDPDGLCVHLRLLTGELYVILEDARQLTRRCEGVVLRPNSRLYEKFFPSSIAGTYSLSCGPRLFSSRFSVVILCMTSAAWEAEVFYCRGGIIDTCRAMFQSFLRGEQSKRQADAWRTFCRYVRYLHHSFTVRQGTSGSQLTKTEQGHIPAFDTMDGLTDIFALLSTALLLNIIDCRQYPEISAFLSLREQEEIRLAQVDAWMLVRFLTGIIDLVEDETREDVSLDDAFISYLILQGRWLLLKLGTKSHVQQEEVLQRLSAAEFLQGDHRLSMLKEELSKELTEEVTDCFTPLSQALKISFPKITHGNMKRKSVQNSTKLPSKRPKKLDGNQID